ncbi:hypothetical protein LOD99_5350 [Oopsacas minuta]|uniref:Helix-turn-helix domain-containing protein n=1 Tax=Oopsacas minuta TaxID=111878 RepID=A0AAV7JR82_9METZ|nr:hypothetical protein LOD99_5350 [Oopsacas minuta]
MNVRLEKVEVRNRAIGMLLSGKTQKTVALSLGKDVSTIQRWWYKHKAHKSLQHKRGAGRPKKLPRVSKIVIANHWTRDTSRQNLWIGTYKHGKYCFKGHCTPVFVQGFKSSPL